MTSRSGERSLRVARTRDSSQFLSGAQSACQGAIQPGGPACDVGRRDPPLPTFERRELNGEIADRGTLHRPAFNFQPCSLGNQSIEILILAASADHVEATKPAA